MICAFKKGDYIIGTKGKILSSGHEDTSWKDTVFKVKGVFESHLVASSVPKQTALENMVFHFDDLTTWGFIIANPEMVELLDK
jgi:hypothetical protein